MALSDRAAALVPYVQQLLYDREVQGAVRRAVGATREAYGRARGESTRQALKDKKLGRRLRQAIEAAREVWSAIAELAPPPKPRWRRRLAVLAVGGAGVFLGVNPEAREKVLDLLGSKDAKTRNPSQ